MILLYSGWVKRWLYYLLQDKMEFNISYLFKSINKIQKVSNYKIHNAMKVQQFLMLELWSNASYYYL